MLVGGLAVVTGAACIGFLFYNWYPAQIFMGDAGSLFLGFMLVATALKLRPSVPHPASVTGLMLLPARPCSTRHWSSSPVSAPVGRSSWAEQITRRTASCVSGTVRAIATMLAAASVTLVMAGVLVSRASRSGSRRRRCRRDLAAPHGASCASPSMRRRCRRLSPGLNEAARRTASG